MKLQSMTLVFCSIYNQNLNSELNERILNPSLETCCKQVLFFTLCSIFLLYLDEVMHAFEKIWGLVIWDWYFSGRMEKSSMKKKGNERKGCQNIVQKLCVHCKISNQCFSSFFVDLFPSILSFCKD